MRVEGLSANKDGHFSVILEVSFPSRLLSDFPPTSQTFVLLDY